RVTVGGRGGAGQPRLAAEVARGAADRFADGVWLVELAGVRDPAQVPSVVAAVLGVREQPGERPVQAVARVLAGQQLLLGLDNCEHVIGTAAEVCAGVVAGRGGARVPATRRVAVRLGAGSVAGSVLFRIGVTWGARPRPRGWRCPPRGPAAPMCVSRWMAGPGRWWGGWWRGGMGCLWRSSWRRRGWRRWA